MYNHTYIVEVEERLHSIFVVKFYLKSHRHSEKRYSLVLSPEQRIEGDSGAFNCLRILNTLLNISKVLIKKDAKASFGFIGAPKLIEMDEEKNKVNINPDGTYKNTTRFRVYKGFVARYYPPRLFSHIEFTNSSGYIIKNKQNKELTKGVVESLLIDYIQTI